MKHEKNLTEKGEVKCPSLSCNIKKTTWFFITLVMILSKIAYAIPAKPNGMPDGGCWADPMNLLNIKSGTARFTSNTPGSTGSVSFKTSPEYYSGWCYSTIGAQGASYFKAVYTGNPEQNDYYHLTDDIDYKISIGLISNDVPIPFNDYYISSAGAGPDTKGVSGLIGALYGNNGSITFRLRRKVIGGAFFFPGGIELAEFYRYVNKGSPSTIPMYRLVTEQTVVPLPVVCHINRGQLIKISFGNIDNMQVTTDAASSLFKEQSTLSYSCNTTLTQDINVNLAANPAGFSDAIQTSNPDIGVVMQYQNQTVKPNEGFKTKLVNGQGNDNVTFSVVSSGKTPKTGPFTGSATLIISNL